MDKNSTFLSERLCFRGINETDTDCLVIWRSDPQTIRYFRRPVPITKEDHERWYQTAYLQDFGRFDYIIIEKQSQKAIGTVGVNHVDLRARSCEISYMIVEPAFQRKGYAVEAIATVMDIAEQEGICLFFVEIHSENIASRRTIEKLGYTCLNEQQPFVTYYKQVNVNGSHTS